MGHILSRNGPSDKPGTIHRIERTSLGAISMRRFVEIRFENRFEHQRRCSLYYPIADSRDGQYELHWCPMRIWDGLRSVTHSIRFAGSDSKSSRHDASPALTP
jgi:hypothetical protein